MPRSARRDGKDTPDREALRHRRPTWVGRRDVDGQAELYFDGSATNADNADAIGGVAAEDVVLDGVPPASSPTPVVKGGIGSLFVSWDAITNHDPVSYEVHVSKTSGFTPSGTTLVENLVANPSLEDDASGYTLENTFAPTSSGRVDEWADDGAWSYEVDGSFGPGGHYAGPRYDGVPATAGVEYSAHVRANLLANPGAQVFVDFRDASNALLGGRHLAGLVSTTGEATLTLSGLVAPAGTDHASVGAVLINVSGAPVAGHAYFDSFFLAASPVADPTFVGEVAGTSFVVRKLPDGSALEYGKTYYVKLVAKDADGSAAASAEASAQVPQITGQDIAVDTVTADNILANSALFDLLRTVLIITNTLKTADSGQRVEIDTDGIRLVDSTGVVLVDLPTDSAETPSFLGDIQATGLQLDAGDGPYWGGGQVPIEFVSTAGDVVGSIGVNDSGDGSEAVGSIVAAHPDLASAALTAANDPVSPTRSAFLRLLCQPAAAAHQKTRVDLFGTDIGAIKLFDETGDSDFATRLGYFDDGSAAASSVHTEVIQFPAYSVWILFARSSGPNEEIANTYLITSGPTNLNVTITNLSLNDFSLGSLVAATENGAAGWSFNASSLGTVKLTFTHGAGGAASWSWTAMRLGNIGAL